MLTVEMKNVTHLDAVGDELAACRLDIGDHEQHFVSRPRDARSIEMDRAGRSGRCQLHRAEVLSDHEIGVESPAQSLVKGLGPIDVRYRNADDFELEIECGAHMTSVTGYSIMRP